MSDGERGAGCARVRARMAIALDGGLAPLEAALDRGPLEACAGCRRERAEHERLLAEIRALSAPRADDLERVSTAVMERVAGARVDRNRWPLFGRRVVAAAAVLLVAWLARDVTGLPHGSLHLGGVDRFLEQLPRWEDVQRGLGALARLT